MAALTIKTSWLNQFMNSSHIGILIVNKSRTNLLVNQRLCEMFGYSQEELLGFSAEKLHINHESFLTFAQKAFNFVLQGKPVSLEYQFKRKNGELFWAHISGDMVEDQDEVLWTFIDINQRKQIEHKLEEHYKFLQAVIDGVNDPIMVIQKDYNVSLMNKTLHDNLKHINLADPKNPKCYEVSHHRTTPCDGMEHPCPLKEVLEHKKPFNVLHQHLNVDGSISNVELAASPLFDSDHNCLGIIESARDITAHLEVQNQLREQKNILDFQAHHDPLTNLPNRLLFEDRLEHSIQKAKRNDTKLALLFIDLDHFKAINDSLGHKTGDEVLKVVTKRLQNSMRKEDTLSRLGGDEFTVILEDIQHIQDISILAQKFLEVLSQSIDIEDNNLYVSSSIGISVYPDDATTSQNLLKFSDSAMYRAKDEGRNNFQFYSKEMTEQAFERIIMQANLHSALTHNEFVVHYQPQTDARTNTLVGMEALVRWQHPNLGLIYPSKFIALAETTGLIVELDRITMLTAMKQFNTWYEQGLNPGILSLNLSVQQIHQKDFIPVLTQMIKQSNCKPEHLKLEVTESQIMRNPQEAIEVLITLNKMGIKIAIDDFGTGYSSLSYLKRLPIDTLKIDQSFVKNLPNNGEDSAITQTIIALASSLHLDVIAEGVETKEQKDFLLYNQCHYIQGYFYAYPMNHEEMLHYLQK